MVDKAAHAFADTERMLRTVEDICGPYVWGVYDLLVLSPPLQAFLWAFHGKDRLENRIPL